MEISTYSKIFEYIKSKQNGTMFISNDFSDFGTNKNIRSSLVRLCDNKVLRRIFRGVYIKFNDKTPDDIAIAKEISRKNKTKSTIFKDEKVNSTRVITFYTNGSTRTHTVGANDTLWGIAKKYYGNGSKWTVIWDANKPMKSGNPNKIYKGEVVKIP